MPDTVVDVAFGPYAARPQGRQFSCRPDDPLLVNLPVEEVIRNRLLTPKLEFSDSEAESAFFVADLGDVYHQHMRWKALLPRIEPFFAVKCNPDPLVVRLLASLGTGFDCASKGEIQQILAAGVDPSRIIYANPCKQSSFIRFAAHHGVKKMTFDNTDELHKIKHHFPGAELVLRILTDDSSSLCQLGLKFGAPLHTTRSLLQSAKELELNVVGVSFHVGSGCADENAFLDAILRARRVFDEAIETGFNLTLLDIGGGFPGAHVGDGITFEKVAAVLGPAVDKYFPESIRVIAEPGRYYVASAFTLATHVIARRIVSPDNNLHPDGELKDQAEFMYYLNDGLYSSFNCILFDHQTVYPEVLMRGGKLLFGKHIDEPKSIASIWGPTCDSIDCITKAILMPRLNVGDWIYFKNMGAYTITAASQFNGFQQSKVLYTNTASQGLPLMRQMGGAR